MGLIKRNSMAATRIRTILLDMDGVCCDFVSAACRANGQDIKDILPKWEPGGGGEFYKLWGATKEEFWGPINGDPSFWVKLKAYPWFGELLEVVFGHVRDQWWFATSPSECPTSQFGKAQWLLEHEFDPDRDAMIGSHKELMAKPGVVLIDDRESNCQSFREEGGHAILFPARWNSNHEHKDNPMPYVRQELERIQRELSGEPCHNVAGPTLEVGQVFGGHDPELNKHARKLQAAGAKFEYRHPPPPTDRSWTQAKTHCAFCRGYEYRMASPPPEYVVECRVNDDDTITALEDSKPIENILEEAIRITAGDRQASYGPPDQDFQRTAKMWEAVLQSCVINGELEIPPRMVAMCMIALKLSRETHQRKRDNWVDIAGYAKCGSLCND